MREGNAAARDRLDLLERLLIEAAPFASTRQQDIAGASTGPGGDGPGGYDPGGSSVRDPGRDDAALDNALNEAARLRKELAAALSNAREKAAQLIEMGHSYADLKTRFQRLVVDGRGAPVIAPASPPPPAPTSGRDTAGVMAGIALAFLRAPFWWALLPRRIQLVFLCRRLRAARIFDDQAYLDDNPDIRGEAIDPLVHCIRYGFREGRPGIAPAEK